MSPISNDSQGSLESFTAKRIEGPAKLKDAVTRVSRKPIIWSSFVIGCLLTLKNAERAPGKSQDVFCLSYFSVIVLFPVCWINDSYVA
jgi:hypothetical protein